MSNSISRIADHYRAQLQQKDDSTAESLTDAHTQTMRRVQPQLERLYAEIDKRREQGQQIAMEWLHEGGRLDALKQYIMMQVDNFAAYARMIATRTQQWATSLGQKVAGMFMKAAKEDYEPQEVSPTTLEQFMMDASDSLRGLFHGFGEDASKGVARILLLEISLQSKVKDIAARIADVLDVPRWRSILIAVTEMYKSFNDVLLMNYKTNEQVTIGWIWHCRLSPRSCVACVALHGTIHKLSETLIDHPRGQCFSTPYIVGMSELQSGVDWFELQDEQTKREILGTNVAYYLYKSGTPLSAFVGVRHDHGYEPSVYQRSVKQIVEGK